jgi:hypothetical protein
MPLSERLAALMVEDYPLDGTPTRRAFIQRPLDFALQHPLFVVALSAFAARVLAIFMIREVIGTDAFGVGDDDTYSWMAEWVVTGRASEWNDYTRQLYNSTATFSVPLTLLYAIFGSVELAGPLLATAFGVLAVVFLARIALELLPRGWAMGAGLTLAVFPSQVLWSSFTLKDSAVWATLTALGVLAAIGARQMRVQLLPVALGLVVSLVLLGHLRPHTLVVASWAVILASFFSVKAWRLQRISGAFLIGVMVPWILGLGLGGLSLVRGQDLEYRRTANAFGAVTAFVPSAEEEVQSVAAEVDQLNREIHAARARLAAAAGRMKPADEKPADEQPADEQPIQSLPGSGSTGDVAQEIVILEEQVRMFEREVERVRKRKDVPPESLAAIEADLAKIKQRKLEAQDRAGSVLQVPGSGEEEEFLSPTIRHVPKGLSVMLLEPYPWVDPPSERVRGAQLETIMWYPLLALAFVGIVFGLRNRAQRMLLMFPALVGSGIAVMYALVEGNFGTAYRHRGEFVWVVVLMAAQGGYALKRRVRPSRREVRGESVDQFTAGA